MSKDQKEIKISLIVSTYNWPEALELCLLSIEAQSELPHEVIIADDGSGAPTKQIVEAFSKKLPRLVKHVWHEDQGFRLAKIRNRAIAVATGDYIVQIDGDIVLHPQFIRDHRLFSKKDTFVRASRIFINQEVSEKMLHYKSIRINAFSKGISNFFSAVRGPFLQFLFEHSYKTKGLERYEIHGCNMAFWRDDAIGINGYNEAFEGWGPEDKEFVARLLNNGKKRRFLKMGGIAFHLYHKENARTSLAQNQRLLELAIKDKTVFCDNGIDKYLT